MSNHNSEMKKEITLNHYLKLSLFIVVLFMTVGCQQEKVDLKDFVEQTKSRQGWDIPPIPVIPPYEYFEYDASNYRDPFTPTGVEITQLEPEPQLTSDNGIQLDENRRKEALEIFELSQLQFVGTLEKEKVWALIRAPDGVIHRVQVGNYMGLNSGKIISINNDEIQLKEIVPADTGGFIERDTSVLAVEVA